MMSNAVVPVDHQGARDGDAVACQQFRQIDLVVAAEDGIRIVDHHQPLRLGGAGKAVGVVVGVGGVADEQGIEFREPVEIVPGDEGGVNPQAAGGALEFFHRQRVGGGFRVVRRVEDGQLQAGWGLPPHVTPAAEIRLGRLHHEGLHAGGNVGSPHRLEPGKLEAFVLAPERGHEERRLKETEELAGERPVAGRFALAERHKEIETL
jgi:hypothetical protein